MRSRTSAAAAQGMASLQNPVTNPQVALATLDGATNYVPSFITANGPVSEARVIQNPECLSTRAWGVTYHPYSDFALHHMGPNLADGINQDAAGPDQFRTAPLWGMGQRLYFMHDRRTSDLLQAIKDTGALTTARANTLVGLLNVVASPRPTVCYTTSKH